MAVCKRRQGPKPSCIGAQAGPSATCCRSCAGSGLGALDHGYHDLAWAGLVARGTAGGNEFWTSASALHAFAGTKTAEMDRTGERPLGVLSRILLDGLTSTVKHWPAVPKRRTGPSRQAPTSVFPLPATFGFDDVEVNPQDYVTDGPDEPGAPDPEELAKCEGCGREKIDLNDPPTTPSAGGCVRQTPEKFAVVGIEYWSPVTVLRTICEYSIQKTKEWICVWCDGKCVQSQILRPGGAWAPDHPTGVVGVPSQPFVGDKPGLPPATKLPNKPARVSKLWGDWVKKAKAADPEGKKGCKVRYLRCSDFITYMIDMDTCEVLSATQWYVVIDVLIDLGTWLTTPGPSLPAVPPGFEPAPGKDGKVGGNGTIAEPENYLTVDAEQLAKTCAEMPG
jgi:hypothetical protein